jgi:hypothetical protein
MSKNKEFKVGDAVVWFTQSRWRESLEISYWGGTIDRIEDGQAIIYAEGINHRIPLEKLRLDTAAPDQPDGIGGAR